MAVKTQKVGDRIRHHSGKNLKILQVETGVVYDDAVDAVPCRYTYTETNEHIDVVEDDCDADE
jgi:hypothetical protein